MALTDNLVAYWKLDESSGNAADAHGSYTLTNTNTVAYASGLINNCADTGTANTNKRLNTSSDLGISTGAQSYSLWVKMRTEPSSGGIASLLDHRDGGSGNKYWMYYTNSAGVYSVVASYGRNGVADYNATYTITLGTSNWHHIVMTYSGSTDNKLYVDGVLRDTATVTAGSGSSITDGTSLYSTANGFLFASAYIDEVGVWNTELTSTDVTNLYNGGSGLAYPLTVSEATFTPKVTIF